MAMRMEEYASTINFKLDDPNVIKYLKGETIEIDTRDGSYVGRVKA